MNIVGIVVSLLSTQSSSSSNSARARADLQKYWPDNRSSTLAEVSADDLWSVCMDFNTSGVPCEIRYISGVGYTLRGTGYCDLPDSAHTSSTGLVQIIGDEFLVYDKYLHSYDGRLIYSSTQPSPKLLRSIELGIDDLLNQVIAIKGQLVDVISKLSSIMGYVDGIEGYIDGVENYLSGQATKLSNIGSYVDGVEGALSTTNTRLNTLIGHVDGVESGLSGIGSSVSSLIELLSPVQYVSAYTSDSSGTAFSTVSLPYDLATSFCANLNSKYVGKSVRMLSRSDDSVSSYPTFEYSWISGNRIRIRLKASDGTVLTSKESP